MPYCLLVLLEEATLQDRMLHTILENGPNELDSAIVRWGLEVHPSWVAKLEAGETGRGQTE